MSDNFIVVRVRKKDKSLAICFRGLEPFMGTEAKAEELRATLSKENPGEVYEIYTVEERNASKGKKRRKL